MAVSIGWAAPRNRVSNDYNEGDFAQARRRFQTIADVVGKSFSLPADEESVYPHPLAPFPRKIDTQRWLLTLSWLSSCPQAASFLADSANLSIEETLADLNYLTTLGFAARSLVNSSRDSYWVLSEQFTALTTKQYRMTTINSPFAYAVSLGKLQYVNADNISHCFLISASDRRRLTACGALICGTVDIAPIWPLCPECDVAPELSRGLDPTRNYLLFTKFRARRKQLEHDRTSFRSSIDSLKPGDIIDADNDSK